MKVSNILKVAMILGAGALAAACSDSKSDPGTESKADLNPPGTLWTVTKSGALELRWTAGNVEEDLNGYYVFIADASKVTTEPTYPAGVKKALSGVPRCLDNTKFFEQFGFKATDKACEDDTATAASTGTKTGLALTDGSMLADSTDTATTTDEEEKLTGWAKCDTGSTADISLAATPPVVTTQSCVISKLAEGTALANGTTYAVFVMSVRDEFKKVSWTSNVITDTPSADALPAGDLKLANNEYIRIDLTPASATAKASAAAACDADTSSLCDRISVNNNVATDAPAVFLSRTKADLFTGFKYNQRLYVSVSTDGSVKLQPRGPQTWDALKGGKAPRIPGDQAAAAYADAGAKYVVYNNQVFDFEVTATGGSYYGKLIVDDVKYASETDNKSDATLNVAVIMQPKAGSRDYFKTATFLQ